jgi:hypothetical protein
MASAGVLVFVIYRFALAAVPWLWTLTDHTGTALSRVAGFISRQPLQTGATFAGLDFLVLTGALLAMSWGFIPPSVRPRWWRVAGAMAAAHLVFLIILSFAPRILALLPPPPTLPSAFGVRAPWDWAQAVRSLVPWNLPALGALLHLVVVGWLLQILLRQPDRKDERAAVAPAEPFWRRHRLAMLLIALALVVPPLAAWTPTRASLEHRKIVVYEKGFLNWLRPKHGEYGRLSVGMYGMLTDFLQHYGAHGVVSPDLSEADLRDTDLVVLIFPNKPWADGQVERIRRFVRNGGSLLLLGEHTVREKDGANRFNDVLEPTALRVAFDSAMFEVGGWLESYDALQHPATAGLEDHRNEFGAVIGASVEARWPARPVLVGRYGFSDQGDATNDESKGGSMMGNHHYDAGEKLGDQILAAEQRFGRGRVMVFGDTSGFSNGILFGSHDFVARLLAVLCSGAWISSARLGCAAIGLGLLAWLAARTTKMAGTLQPSGPIALALAVLGLAASSTATSAWNHRAATVLPDGRFATPNRLAYLDTSHAERASLESWRDDGLGGFELTLMRNGYLTLGLHDFTAERLQRAGLLFSAAPSRPFTASEIRIVREFVESGGIFICTVGWPEASASRALLAELGFYVGGIGAATSGQPEPKPYGHFKAPYFNGGDYMAYVRFHAAWPVESSDPQARPLAYGPRDPQASPDQPDPTVILMRRSGRGKIVVVADSEFATNRNLEHEGGQPFEGMRENADFWRWLLDTLNDQTPWTPPKPAPAPLIPGPATERLIP